jgi:hypothetical protein
MIRNLFFTALLGAASLVAQGTCYQLPTGGSVSGKLSPFGSAIASNTKYQLLMLNTDVTTPGNICELEFMSTSTGTRHFDSIRIRLGYFALTGTTLGTTFSANLKNAQTVLDAKNYDWPYTGNVWGPIGLQKSFNYVPQIGHLVIEITVVGVIKAATGQAAFRADPSRQYIYSNGWTTEPTTGTLLNNCIAVEVCYKTAMANVYGLGCPGSNNTTPALVFTGTPKLSSSFSVDISSGPANANMFLVLGMQRPQTPLLLPGTTKCHAYPSLDVLILQTMTSTGTFSQNFAVPNQTGLTDVKVYAQAFPWDSNANAFGASASNYGRLRVGL